MKILRNIWLCLKYPFLWPRNRFTGLHYNNWKLLDLIKRVDGRSRFFVHLSLTDKDIEGPSRFDLPGGRYLDLEVHKKSEVWVILGKSGSHWERIVSRLTAPGVIDEVAWGEKGTIQTKLFKDPGEPRFISSEIIYDRPLWLWGRILEWIHKWPLQIFHCLPRYTELDAMEGGWRKAFGEDLCREIRGALWKNGGLRSILRFRITQVKEKFGALRMYCASAPEDVYEVISKYERISSEICIVCGKPATYISKGWISPYCDDHIEDKDWADPIEKEEGN